MTFGKGKFQDAIISTQWILADVGTVAPAWFILATNKQLRQEVINLFDFGGNIVMAQNNVHIISTTSSMQRAH
uniref:Uncharacterized protein n=1 Tax=Panagrolaimus sp. ES5 TaxID=591445 RepID=A0AC34GGJ3_9BILA